MRRVICTVLIVLCAHANAEDDRVAAVEKHLYNTKDEKERLPIAQKFFAELTDPAEKIKALGMLDSRYVYFVPKELNVEILTRLIHDTDLRVRARAARAIGYNGLGSRFPKELLELLNERDVEIKKNALYAMAGGGDEFLAPIKAHLHDADPEIRHEAAYAYAGWISSEQHHYFELLKDPDPELRIMAAETAIRSSRYNALADALKLLDDPSEMVRYRTVRALEFVDSAVEAVAAKLKDIPAVRAIAVETLAAMHDREKYVDVIGALLNDADENVRLAVIRALGEMRAEKYIPQLTELKEHASGIIQLRAKEALELMERVRAATDPAQKKTNNTRDVRVSRLN